MSKRNPRAKWVLPEVVDPRDRICFQIQVPNEKYHIAAFLGALYNLTSAIFWADDPSHTAKQVARVWQEIYDNLSRQCENEFINTYVGMVDDMPFFRQICENDICYLEFECCPGEWVRLGREDQIPAGSQPAAGAPQPPPGGGTADYCATLQANNKLYIPTIVSAGDIISIQATGAGNDGGEIQWRCPDGSTFFAGHCNPSETRLDGADPLPATNHMALIVNVDGTFYPFASNSFTVPGGVSNAPAYIQANDSDITNNSGSYQICVTAKNNQPATWTHTFDFSAETGGWILSPGRPTGSWSAGSGWVEGDDNDGGSGAFFRRVLIQRNFASTHIDRVEVLYNYMYGNIATGTDDAYYLILRSSGVATIYGRLNAAAHPSNGAHDEIYNTNQQADLFEMYIATDQNNSGVGFTGAATISKVVVTGTGTNPF